MCFFFDAYLKVVVRLRFVIKNYFIYCTSFHCLLLQLQFCHVLTCWSVTISYCFFCFFQLSQFSYCDIKIHVLSSCPNPNNASCSVHWNCLFFLTISNIEFHYTIRLQYLVALSKLFLSSNHCHPRYTWNLK